MTVWIQTVSDESVNIDDLESDPLRVVILKHETEDDRQFVEKWLKHNGIEGKLRFNDGNPAWFLTILSDEELMKVRLAFFSR